MLQAVYLPAAQRWRVFTSGGQMTGIRGALSWASRSELDADLRGANLVRQSDNTITSAAPELT